MNEQMSQDKSEQLDIFGQRLEQVRRMLHLTAKEFCEQLGIAYRTYMNYKSGRTPPADLLARVIDEFAVNPAWLMTGNGKPLLKAEHWERLQEQDPMDDGGTDDDPDEEMDEDDEGDEDGERLAKTEASHVTVRSAAPILSTDLPPAKPGQAEPADPQLRLMTHLVSLHEENRDLRQRVEELEQTLTRAVVRRRKSRRRATF